MQDNTPIAKRKKIVKIALIAFASIAFVGAVGYGTITVLRQIKAPTMSSTTQPQPSSTAIPEPAIVTPEKAQSVADAAYEAGDKKVAEGDQKAALADYKKAYENYKIAQNSSRADDAQFIIKSIEAVLAASSTPSKPAGLKAAAKE